MVAAVLFDMDGLLVDSEPVWYAAEVDYCRAHDAAWSHADQHRIMGTSLENVARTVREFCGLDAEQWPETAQALVQDMCQRYRHSAPAWMPGAQELVRGLREAGVPTALVSTSKRELMDAALAGLLDTWNPDGTPAQVKDLFDVTVSGDEVQRSKPDPQPYLHACEQLGVDPARCVVLEDSLTGARAGLAAGCTVISVRPTTEGLEALPHQERLRHRRSLEGLTPTWLAGR